MGRIGDSKDWGVIKSGKRSPLLRLLEATFAPIGKSGLIVWPIAAAASLELGEDGRQFAKLASETMDERLEVS